MDSSNLVVVTRDLEAGHHVIAFYSMIDDSWEVKETLIEDEFDSVGGVALSGEMALVGFPFSEKYSFKNSGVVFVYEQNRYRGWEKIDNIYPPPEYS